MAFYKNIYVLCDLAIPLPGIFLWEMKTADLRFQSCEVLEQAKLTTGAKKYEQWWLLGVAGKGNDWKMEWVNTPYFDTDGITQAYAFVKIHWSVYFLIYKLKNFKFQNLKFNI